jgi:6-phosphogluconolactonase
MVRQMNHQSTCGNSVLHLRGSDREVSATGSRPSMARWKWLKNLLAIASLIMAVTPAGLALAEGDAQWVYVGTYTRGTGSEGIYVCRLDNESGKLELVSVAEGVDNPSFVAIHPSGSYLYAVGETADFQGGAGGAVGAFSIDRATGKLTMLNGQSSEGGGPCHLVVDATGKVVLVANYGGGSVASLPIGEDGRLGPAATKIQHVGSSVNPQRQAGPHAHSINVDCQNRFAFAADLGLDKILVYRLDPEKATLAEHDPAFASLAEGAGPRHFAFHPSGKYAYVINEMTCTMTTFTYDAENGELTEVQTVSTLPGRGTSASLRSIRLWFKPRSRQHRDFRRGPGDRKVVSSRSRIYSGKDAA